MKKLKNPLYYMSLDTQEVIFQLIKKAMELKLSNINYEFEHNQKNLVRKVLISMIENEGIWKVDVIVEEKQKGLNLKRIDEYEFINGFLQYKHSKIEPLEIIKNRQHLPQHTPIL